MNKFVIHLAVQLLMAFTVAGIAGISGLFFAGAIGGSRWALRRSRPLDSSKDSSVQAELNSSTARSSPEELS